MDDIVIFRNKCGSFSENEISHILIDTYLYIYMLPYWWFRKVIEVYGLFWKNKVMALKEGGEFSDFMFLK